MNKCVHIDKTLFHFYALYRYFSCIFFFSLFFPFSLCSSHERQTKRYVENSKPENKSEIVREEKKTTREKVTVKMAAANVTYISLVETLFFHLHFHVCVSLQNCCDIYHSLNVFFVFNFHFQEIQNSLFSSFISLDFCFLFAFRIYLLFI